jgi:Ni/Co efflux regulator RcnB
MSILPGAAVYHALAELEEPMLKSLSLALVAGIAAPLALATPAAAQHHGHRGHHGHHYTHHNRGNHHGDWRAYRRDHRHIYRRGHWHAPFRYHGFRAGVRIAPTYYGPRYYIGDPGRYRLPPAGPYRRWVRHYDDVLLVDVRSGIVLRVLRDFYW